VSWRPPTQSCGDAVLRGDQGENVPPRLPRYNAVPKFQTRCVHGSPSDPVRHLLKIMRKRSLRCLGAGKPCPAPGPVLR
jgi:hypothetical protein